MSPLQVVYKRHVLPRESCFENAEYDIMKQSWEWQRSKRTTFADLKEQLGKLHDHAANSGNCNFITVGRETEHKKSFLAD